MPDRGVVQEAFLLPLEGGERFCVVRKPASGPARGVVVHAPPFAEEMNKSRRMTAWCARELAARGYAVVQVDPIGSGDSPGDFGDATWDAWIRDIAGTAVWARSHHAGEMWLWGLRAGALLASAALAQLPSDTSLLLWQPVVSGRLHLTQFLRLALAAGVLAADAERVGTKLLHEELGRGRAVEVAGYRLSPALASGLSAATLDLPPGFGGRIVWLEVAGNGTASPAARNAFSGLQARARDATLDVVIGPSFWQSVEIEDCPALIDATLASLSTRNDATLRRATAVL
jgi:exosortase A-associated hydrolase 2